MKRILILGALVIMLVLALAGTAFAAAPPAAACDGLHRAHCLTHDTPAHANIPMCADHCPGHE